MEKHKVTIVKNLGTMIKDLKDLFYSPELIENGREIKRLGYRPREILALTIMCALQNCIDLGTKFKISTDPFGYDGILTDLAQDKPRNFGIEQTFVSQKNSLDINEAIKGIILNKEKKGVIYARGRNLITIINKIGVIDPQKLISLKKEINNFASYWIIFKEANTKSPTYIAVMIKSRVEEDMMMFRVYFDPPKGKYNAEYLGKLDS